MYKDLHFFEMETIKVCLTSYIESKILEVEGHKKTPCQPMHQQTDKK